MGKNNKGNKKNKGNGENCAGEACNTFNPNAYKGYVPAEKGVTRRNNPDGTPNRKYVDMLEVDREIAGQKYVCMSFVSPELVLRRKELYIFSKFVEQWDMTKSMKKFQDFLGFLCHKYKLVQDDVINDLKEFIQTEQQELANYDKVKEDFDTFVENFGAEWEKKFDQENEFQTSVRGVKVRGVFATEEEAKFRAKMLREADQAFDVYVGPVGTWVPWEQEAYRMKNVEYMEEELNQLVQEKQKNEEFAKAAFDQRVKEMKQKAIQENKEKAAKHGFALTQDVDENGELVGVQDGLGASTVEKNIFNSTEEVTVEDVANELFHGDTVVVPKGDGKLPQNVGVEVM